MKRIAIAIRLKRRVFNTKFRLWKHKLEYRIYQRPDSALFWFVMLGLFLVQLMLFLGA